MTKRALIVAALAVVGFAPQSTDQAAIHVGSKKFTESVILGEMVRLLITNSGYGTRHLRELGGTRLVFETLKQGEIDVYPEYTGTLVEEIFARRSINSQAELRAALGELDIEMSAPLGFNNTYALGMLKSRADALSIRTMSDLARHPELRYGFGNEFLERSDGWDGLRFAYQLTPTDVTGMDHDVAYQQLELGLIDVMDVYTTDARIDALELQVLEDDREYFPRYDAVLLYRKDLQQEFGTAVEAVQQMAGKISAADMVACNRDVELTGRTESESAAEFIRKKLGVEFQVAEPSRFERIMTTTIEHLHLVRRSLIPAILCGVPLGILASRRRWLGQFVLGVVGIFQTIPSLALLVLLLPLAAALGLASVGAGSGTAILALFLYSLLPIVRNTYSGITSIDSALIESAEVLNLPGWFCTLEIELPLASRSILAGIKTSAVMNIGFATLGALVGAGGYGQPILSGIRLADTSLVLEGAVPSAVLAVSVQALFELVERVAVPRGLRITQS
jgi:osmoprotectant transport system permease protein